MDDWERGRERLLDAGELGGVRVVTSGARHRPAQAKFAPINLFAAVAFDADRLSPTSTPWRQ